MPAREHEIATRHENRSSGAREAPALQIGRLYEQHQRMIGALCRVLLRDSVEAEDALQQTFLSALGSLIAGTEPRQPAAWLATIARRECWARTAQRRRRPLPLDEAADPADGSGDPIEDAIRSADFAALWRAIDGLPRTQRRAFLMREFSGLSYAEVAVALGVTESAIESLLVRARRQLRDGLATTAATANVALTPLVVLQQRVLRLFGGNNTAARTGAATAVGAPAAVKVAATTAVIVAVGSVGAGVKTTLFAGHRPARPVVAAPKKASSGPLAARVVGTRRLPEPHHLRASRAGRLILQASFPTPARPTRSHSVNATVGAAEPRGSSSTDSLSEPTTTGAAEDPPEVSPPSSAPTDTTSTDPPHVDTLPADSPPSDGSQPDGAQTDPTQTDATQTDPTQTDPAQTDPTQTDPAQTDPAQTDS